MKTSKWLLFIMFLTVTCLSHGYPFPLNGYCSKFTGSGHWYASWGSQDPRFHCVLVEHRLGPLGSEIEGSMQGYYDAFDMIHVKVSCKKKKHSFSLTGFGDEIIWRAYDQARKKNATHCLFTLSEGY